MVIIYGGTFNPPTIAHDQIIKLIHKEFNPEKIILVPSSDGYYKDGLIPFFHRINMLEIMTKNYNFNYEISLAEKSTNFNGTIELLNHFNQIYEDIWFVVGSDHLNIFNTWIDYDKLLTNYKFIIITRPGYEINLTYLNKYKTVYKIIKLNVNVSSSEVRLNLEKNKEFLPNGIYSYIKENKLFNKREEI